MFVYSGGLDQITEGNGTDRIHIQGGVTINDVTVSDFNSSGNDDAKIVITASVDEIIVHNQRHASSGLHIEALSFDDGFETDLLLSYNSWLKGTSGNDLIIGSADDNALIGYDGDDTIDAGAGADDAHGGAGADTIHGDGGNDLLHGGEGNDTLYCDDGLDTLFGGAGADTFVFESASAFNAVD